MCCFTELELREKHLCSIQESIDKSLKEFEHKKKDKANSGN